MNAPKNLNELFPSEYLRRSDLQGKTWTMVVSSVEVKLMRSKFSNEDEWKAVLHFEGAQKGLVLNKTNAVKMAALARDESFEKWTGLRVALVPSMYKGKETIVIEGAN